MTYDDEALVPLHMRWQTALNDAIEHDGVDPVLAVETMMTVATANKVQVEGAERVAHHLFVLAHMMTAEVKRDAQATRQ